MGKAPRKTEGVTFRLEKETLETLKRESELKEISLNTLANQIFNQHTDFSATAGKAGLISFPKPLLVKILDKFAEEEVAEIAKTIADTEIADIMYIMRRKYDLPSFLEVIESWVRASGFPYHHSEKNGEHSFVIQHDMSKKWSLYLAKMFEHTIGSLSDKRAKFEATGNTLVFTVQT